MVTHADLATARWEEFSDESATRIAQSIAAENDLSFMQAHRHEFAGQSHRVALFERDGMRLSLVPAARVQLGYEGTKFCASAAQAADYVESAAEYDLPELREFVDTKTSPVRTVDLPAMLVATEALDIGTTSLEPDDPRVQTVVAEVGVFPGLTLGPVPAPANGVTVSFDQAGRVCRARLVRQVSYEEAVLHAAALGARPTTPDEWEYACGAGASTLFRWGDQTPEEGYPDDHRTGLHRDLNLWGIAIGQNPYRHEWTSERTIVCGGDGGSATCGGAGFFLGWLTLATAYRDTDFGAWLNSTHGHTGKILLRPVIDIA